MLAETWFVRGRAKPIMMSSANVAPIP